MNLGFSDPQPPTAGQGKFEGISRGMKAIKYPPDSAATHAADRPSVRSLSSGPWILSSPSLLSPAMISLPQPCRTPHPPCFIHLLLHNAALSGNPSFGKLVLTLQCTSDTPPPQQSTCCSRHPSHGPLIAHSLVSCPYSARKSLTEGRSHTLFHFVSLV